MANGLPFVSTAEINAFATRYVLPCGSAAVFGPGYYATAQDLFRDLRSERPEPLWTGDSSEDYDRKFGYRS